MMTLKRFLLFIAGIFVLSACAKEEMYWEKEVAGEPPVVITIPFEGEYLGILASGAENITKCCDGFSHTIIDGTGTASSLGNSTMHFNFCSAGVDHGQACSYIVSGNGDSLYVCSLGEFIPGKLPQQPAFVTSYWRSQFVIRGGTGKFKGASGGGMTDDYISSEDALSHHHWTGTITLLKGNH
jgi:hypothetical protein